MSAIDRRGFVMGLGATLAAGLARPAGAATRLGLPWTLVPAVTVFTADGDPRLPLVEDAVAFWNRSFAELGSGFRLGALSVTANTIPSGDLRNMSAATLSSGRSPPMPEWMSARPGQLVVALSDQEFISFSSRWIPAGRALVAIKNGRNYPLTLPNVARNVIAHEMGHAIGLGHDSDPALLMCGRPAPCRPDAFQSTTARYFPLAEDEKALLLSLYPATWRAS